MSNRRFAVSFPEAARSAPGRRRRHAPALAACLLLGVCATALAADEPPRREAVQAVVARLSQDPDLGGVEKTHRLQWKKKDEEAPAPQPDSWLLRLVEWLSKAFAALAEGGRWLVWLIGASALALIALRLHRWLGARPDALPALSVHPTQVGALDVRPESLPEAIGAAARALWLKGERRAALSLLYRGALSRLIHRYAVPIRAAHTESECLALAGRTLAAEQRDFFAELVGVWQRAVYGARDPEDAPVLRLCADFERILGAAAVAPQAAGTAA